MSWEPVTGALPLTSMVPRPAPSGNSPAMKFNSVVLPQPLGPTIETNSPGLTVSENSLTATRFDGAKITETLSSTTEPAVAVADKVLAPAEAGAAGTAIFIVQILGTQIKGAAAPCPRAPVRPQAACR